MKIITAEPLPPTSLRLRWADGYEAVLDFDPVLPEGDALRDPNLFGQVRINGLTVEWPGGIDYCPDTLRRWSLTGLPPPAEK